LTFLQIIKILQQDEIALSEYKPCPDHFTDILEATGLNKTVSKRLEIITQ